MTSTLHGQLAERLRTGRSKDGGFGARPQAVSEPEPTALVAIALDDEAARQWLLGSQAPDGSVPLRHGVVDNDSPTSVATIALAPGPARDRAVGYLEHHLALTVATSPSVPIDGTSHGWAWVDGTFGWVEPTARAVLALRLAGRASVALNDGVDMLTRRQCQGGGWNYGNRIVWGTALEPFVQTTALGLLALQGDASPEAARLALDVLERQWVHEPGALSLGLALVALELHGRADAHRAAILDRLEAEFAETAFLDDVVAMAWVTIATGEQWTTLRVPA